MEKIWESIEQDFMEYGRSLNSLSQFNYLGRILIASDNYWPVVVRNLRKAQKKGYQMTSILGREG